MPIHIPYVPSLIFASLQNKDQVRNVMSGVPTVDIGLVDFSLAEKKLILDNLPHFIRMELWDAPSGIAIVSNKIEVVYLEERALTSIQSMTNTVMPSLGDVNHSPKLEACCCARLPVRGGILANGDGEKVSNTDEDLKILAEDSQWG
jgi:hypothetical protein